LIFLAIFVLYGRSESDDEDGANALFLLIFLVVILLNIGLSIYKFVTSIRKGTNQVQKVQSANVTNVKMN